MPVVEKCRRRVVVTGIGCVSPNGIGAENFAMACLAGHSGLSRITGIDLAPIRSRVAAQVHDFDPLTAMDAAEVRRVPRMVPMALAASREALAMSGIRIDPDDLE